MDRVLTPRELQVLRLNAFGLTNESIARKLNITLGTVQTYQTRLRKRLGATTRGHAVAIGYESGLIRTGTVRAGISLPGIEQRVSFIEEQLTKVIMKLGQP